MVPSGRKPRGYIIGEAQVARIGLESKLKPRPKYRALEYGGGGAGVRVPGRAGVLQFYPW